MKTMANQYRYFLMISLALLTLTAGASERSMDKSLLRFDQLFKGEFDNYNQVNFETNDFLPKDDIPELKHTRLYKKVVRLNAPQLGKFVYYEQTHAGGREQKIYRKSIAVVTADFTNNLIVSRNYKLKTDIDIIEQQNKLSLSDLTALGEQCDTHFKLNGDSFIGKIDPLTCKVQSKHGGVVHIGGNFVISLKGYWHLEAGYKPDQTLIFGRNDNNYYKLSRAQRFKCWAAFKTDKLKSNGEAKWDFIANLSMHDQGDIFEFTTSSSEPKHYFIRLKQTVFPAGKRPDVFEMFIHENTEKSKSKYKEALAYTWTNADAKRLGINLRWMQASCNLE